MRFLVFLSLPVSVAHCPSSSPELESCSTSEDCSAYPGWESCSPAGVCSECAAPEDCGPAEPGRAWECVVGEDGFGTCLGCLADG